MRFRRLVALLVVALLVTGCGSGPSAPPITSVRTECASDFCVDFPSDWTVVELGADFLTLSHPAAPDVIQATVGQVNMEGIVGADGMAWPQPIDVVVRSFWNLIDDGDAELATLSPQEDGSLESFGTFRGGRLWHRLSPVSGVHAVGVEVRAPNSTWAEHAETIMGSLVVFEP